MPEATMTERSPHDLIFDDPPVIETRLSIQFDPLVNLRVGHFGLFWQDCVDSGEWEFLRDLSAQPREVEQFGTRRLNPDRIGSTSAVPSVCMNLTRRDKLRSIQLQADRLTYGWNREGGERPSYSTVKTEFETLVGRFEAFAGARIQRSLVANLWHLTYVNAIRPGDLWRTPSDWHKVLPGIFPEDGPRSGKFPWTTFNGTWYFEIPPELGRVRVQVQKAVRDKSEEVFLLMVLRAQGEIGPGRVDSWSAGLDVGHEAVISLFETLSSEAAKREWRMRS